MNHNHNIASLTPKTEISVFQALTCLLKKYHDASYMYDKVKSIYLTGVRDKPAERMLHNLLDDPLFDAYIINTNKQAINDDPVRRYFESHLCHNTLVTSLDLLDIERLDSHFNAIFNLIEKDEHALLKPLIDGHASPGRINEYSEGLAKLERPNSYSSLQPQAAPGRTTPKNILDDRKKKLCLLVKCMFATKYVPEAMVSGEVIFDIYSKKNSVYAHKYRGRISRVDVARREDGYIPIDQTSCSQNLGIMRSFMPLPTNDALRAEEPSTRARAADTFTYAKGFYYMPDQIFSNKVTPFVSSISGIMLMKLRVIAQLLRQNQFVFDGSYAPYDKKNKQLELFFKLFVAYMIYHAGGHSLDEYLQVLELKIVQQEFKNLKGFSELTLINLFQKDNTEAFNKTIAQTLIYNDTILIKKKLHLELKTQHNVNMIVAQSNQTPPAMIGTLCFEHLDKHSAYTVFNASILGGTLLFALIRLLNHQALPENKNNDLLQRLKQLIFVLCMVAVARVFDAKIIREKKIAPNAISFFHINSTQKNVNTCVSTLTQHILDCSVTQDLEPTSNTLATHA